MSIIQDHSNNKSFNLDQILVPDEEGNPNRVTNRERVTDSLKQSSQQKTYQSSILNPSEIKM